MTKKQLKQIASRIAKQEKIIQTSNDPFIVDKAKNEIMKIHLAYEESSDFNMDDMLLIDEFVMELLENI